MSEEKEGKIWVSDCSSRRREREDSRGRASWAAVERATSEDSGVFSFNAGKCTI